MTTSRGCSRSWTRATRRRASTPGRSTHVRGEAPVVTVHGRARLADLGGGDQPFRQVLRDHYGQDWDDWGSGAPYYVIEPDRVLAADMRRHQQEG